MKNIPTLDLHPQALPGTGPEIALAAARAFIRGQIQLGGREARLITGLGLHGDGTPRLRRRVETEVLPGFGGIEQVSLEQGGAVLRLVFKRTDAAENQAHLRHLAKEKNSRDFAAREERLMVAGQRLEAARDSLEEGDLRKTRLKTGQLVREFLPGRSVPGEGPALERLLDELKKELRRLGL